MIICFFHVRTSFWAPSRLFSITEHGTTWLIWAFLNEIRDLEFSKYLSISKLLWNWENIKFLSCHVNTSSHVSPSHLILLPVSATVGALGVRRSGDGEMGAVEISYPLYETQPDSAEVYNLEMEFLLILIWTSSNLKNQPISWAVVAHAFDPST